MDRLVGYDRDSTPQFGPRYEPWGAGCDDVAFSVASYRPYATTLFGNSRRAMPTDGPRHAAPGEVYGIVGWILAENGVVARDAVMNGERRPRPRCAPATCSSRRSGIRTAAHPVARLLRAASTITAIS